MSWRFWNIVRPTRPLGCAVGALLIAQSSAFAAECPPVQTTSSCVEYQARLLANSCLNPGSVFIELDDRWTPTVRLNIPFPRKKVLNFFYVVDASRTKQPNGIVFVGIIRTLGTSSSAVVRLTQNQELGFDKTESIVAYSAALNWRASATAVLNRWGTLPDTEPIFRESHLAELKELDFRRPNDQADMHARLYRFQSGGGIMCIPFDVGAPNSIDTIYGNALDVLGTKGQADQFAIKIGY